MTLPQSPDPIETIPIIGDWTDDPDTRFINLAGEPEIWKIGDKAYVVYFTPHEPAIPMLWEVKDTKTLRSYFGGTPTFDRKFGSLSEVDRFGAIEFGSSDELQRRTGDPWQNWLTDFEAMFETQPWLQDPEIFGIYAAAWLENREVEQWEIASTDYWRALNEAQRSWIELAAWDPQEAATQRATALQSTIEVFAGYGVDVPDEIAKFISEKVLTGYWTAEYADQQILGLVGRKGQGSVEFDDELREFMKNNELEVGESVLHEDRIRDLYLTWLGPAHMPSDKAMLRWKDEYNRNPEAAQEMLIESLRSQRMGLFPQYENENLTYEDIAGPWRRYVANAWGETPNELDPAFLKVLRMNDEVEAGKYLRQVGWKRNNSTVTQQFRDGLDGVLQGTGAGQVRNPL